MNKRIAVLVLGLALLGAGCTSYYTLIQETPPSAALNSFATLSFGWIDFGEDKAKLYGFEGQETGKWMELIKEVNQKAFPQYLKELLPGKTVLGAASKSEPPKKEGLIVVFSDISYNQRTSSAAQIMFGASAGSDSLDATVHFIDAASGQELAVSKISLTTQAGTAYSQYTFEGRFNNAVYNLARFISEKVQ